MFDKCPGAAQFTRTPTLKIKRCPECAEDVEIFSTDMQVKCGNCGFIIYNDLESCIQWCKYAKECVGEELYNKLKRKRVVFLCVGNASRSQIAEALAKKLCHRPNLQFASAGTQPADEVEPKALEVLREEGITWHGKPKTVPDKEAADVVVTLGGEVECPTISGAEIIAWDIPDPKGKDVKEYRRVLSMIKRKISQLLKQVE
ncbi:MAG: hypothetical protein E3J34_00730 [Dehalococcoidia bacterium]|nr:MAG: hypothetical protein E3J34_00730 [Dehalococcoidia bacterium]